MVLSEYLPREKQGLQILLNAREIFRLKTAFENINVLRRGKIRGVFMLLASRNQLFPIDLQKDIQRRIIEKTGRGIQMTILLR